VSDTHALYEDAGYHNEERATRLETLKQSMQDDQLKIATIGEFSRGKSSLINALLGYQMLPTAQEQTTAINCFISGLSERYPKPCIEIVYVKGHKEVLDYSYEALEKWSTELNREHRDARLDVDRINIHTDHALFQHRVTLIDTPGFQGILERHELIARQAMDQAHVALWVQSTEQLGGNKSEWDFMRESVAKNYGRFITAVNMWDSVLEPNTHDVRRAQMSQAEWERNRLDVVRENFTKQAEGVLSAKDIRRLTSEENLIGVSAHWALSEDPERRRRSNIARLARRIEELVSEGQGDKLITPLRKLLNEHLAPYITALADERAQLSSDKSLEDRQRELETLKTQAERLKLRRDSALNDSRAEHIHSQREAISDLQELVNPVKALKDELDALITEEYVRKIIERDAQHGVKVTITLDAEHQARLEEQLQRTQQAWPRMKDKVEAALRDLAKEFLSSMESEARAMSRDLSGVSFSFPELDVKVEADVSGLMSYYQRLAEAQEAIELLEEQTEELGNKIARDDLARKRLEEERREHQRKIDGYESRKSGMGPPPPIDYREESYETGGWRSKTRYRTVEDNTALMRYEQQQAELSALQANEAAALQKIKDNFWAATQQHLNDEQARAKLTQEIARKKRQLEKIAEEVKGELQDRVRQYHSALRRSTVRQLEQLQRVIEQTATEAISMTFTRHLELLTQQVEQHYITPIEEAERRCAHVQEVLAQGSDVAGRRVELLTSLQARAEELSARIVYLRDERIPLAFG
ncbi:MAG: hypothetical protein FJ138_10050, partial [Deltaproteobacteria bacterium]|nr:hypothetical protein [Deltaproteobacteria bacterium]